MNLSKVDRPYIETLSPLAAGYKDETPDWYWCRVLSLFDMYVMKGDKSLTPHLLKDGYWESWITAWFYNNVKPGMQVFDIGANCGYYSMLSSSLGAEVTAFEPNPAYFEMLNATVERNGLSGKIAVSPLAVSNERGMAELHVPKFLHGSASFNDIDPQYEVSTVEVETCNLDSFSFMPDKYLIKIDAEGAEEKIWNGMKRVLKELRPTILLEYTPGAYSPSFINKLESYAALRRVSFDGRDELISPEWLVAQKDWVMLVLRKSA